MKIRYPIDGITLGGQAVREAAQLNQCRTADTRNQRVIFKLIAAVGVTCNASLIKSEMRFVKSENAQQVPILIWVYI